MRTAYGVVTMPNDASSALHQKLGFRTLGTYHNTGYKNGRWLDVVWFEKPIGSPPTHKPTPAPRRQKQRGARHFRQGKHQNQQEATQSCPRCNQYVVYF